MKKSKIPYDDSRSGLFAVQSVGKEDGLRFCYGLLVLADLIRSFHRTKIYGEAGMQVTIENFRKLANELRGMDTDKNVIDRNVWIFLCRSVLCVISVTQDTCQGRMCQILKGGRTE